MSLRYAKREGRISWGTHGCLYDRRQIVLSSIDSRDSQSPITDGPRGAPALVRLAQSRQAMVLPDTFPRGSTSIGYMKLHRRDHLSRADRRRSPMVIAGIRRSPADGKLLTRNLVHLRRSPIANHSLRGDAVPMCKNHRVTWGKSRNPTFKAAVPNFII